MEEVAEPTSQVVVREEPKGMTVQQLRVLLDGVPATHIVHVRGWQYFIPMKPSHIRLHHEATMLDEMTVPA